MIVISGINITIFEVLYLLWGGGGLNSLLKI